MDGISREQKLDMLRVMRLIRCFELKMQDLFKQRTRAGEAVGAIHSYEGQEAVAAGVCACLRDDDYIFSTHRGHGHAIAKGLDLKRMAAELLGRSTGCSGGRGGSMHLFDVNIGQMGGNGIVGGGLPLALGTAFSAQYRQTDQVTVCFYGEGAASQGSCHESINMAAVHKFPVIYVCENNQYSATTHVSKNCPIDDIADRAAGYGIPGKIVDGNSVLDVYEATGECVARARGGDGPSLLEFKTYRHRPHCMVIPEHRPADELANWKGRDPIGVLEAVLLEEDATTRDELDQIAAEVERTIDDAIEYGLNSPLPRPESVTELLWA